MDFCEELQKPSIQCQLAKPNEKFSGRKGKKSYAKATERLNPEKTKAAHSCLST